ncbi:hypothetical protein EV368DRAFT_88136 [Lentinula lateritia]|nr:hypothetical protein EV368DRAFT_88136 [Lentinula lateritia]
MSIVWDLDIANVEAISYVKLRVASPLLPPTLGDVSLHLRFPGPPSRTYTPSGALTSRTPYVYDLTQSYTLLATSSPANVLGTSQDLLGTSSTVNLLYPNYSSFPSTVAVPVTPFELQLALSTLQHKPLYQNPP